MAGDNYTNFQPDQFDQLLKSSNSLALSMNNNDKGFAGFNTINETLQKCIEHQYSAFELLLRGSDKSSVGKNFCIIDNVCKLLIRRLKEEGYNEEELKCFEERVSKLKECTQIAAIEKPMADSYNHFSLPEENEHPVAVLREEAEPEHPDNNDDDSINNTMSVTEVQNGVKEQAEQFFDSQALNLVELNNAPQGLPSHDLFESITDLNLEDLMTKNENCENGFSDLLLNFLDPEKNSEDLNNSLNSKDSLNVISTWQASISEPQREEEYPKNIVFQIPEQEHLHLPMMRVSGNGDKITEAEPISTSFPITSNNNDSMEYQVISIGVQDYSVNSPSLEHMVTTLDQWLISEPSSPIEIETNIVNSSPPSSIANSLVELKELKEKLEMPIEIKRLANKLYDKTVPLIQTIHKTKLYTIVITCLDLILARKVQEQSNRTGQRQKEGLGKVTNVIYDVVRKFPEFKELKDKDINKEIGKRLKNSKDTSGGTRNLIRNNRNRS